MKTELSNLKEVDKVIEEILKEVSPCCKAEFEEAEGSSCCNAEISETGICMNLDCLEHAETEGYFCNECDESFETPEKI